MDGFFDFSSAGTNKQVVNVNNLQPQTAPQINNFSSGGQINYGNTNIDITPQNNNNMMTGANFDSQRKTIFVIV